MQYSVHVKTCLIPLAILILLAMHEEVFSSWTEVTLEGHSISDGAIQLIVYNDYIMTSYWILMLHSKASIMYLFEII